MPGMRIALQRLLNDQRKAIEPLAHVGVARRQPSRTPVGIAIIASQAPLVRAATTP